MSSLFAHMKICCWVDVSNIYDYKLEEKNGLLGEYCFNSSSMFFLPGYNAPSYMDCQGRANETCMLLKYSASIRKIFSEINFQ